MQYVKLFTLYNNETYYYLEQNNSNDKKTRKRNLHEFDGDKFAVKLLAVSDDGQKKGEQKFKNDGEQ